MPIPPTDDARYIRWFRDITLEDLPLVGGKNASLGEMYRELTAAGVRVPEGFAITADAYSAVIEAGRLGIGSPGCCRASMAATSRRWRARARRSARSSRRPLARRARTGRRGRVRGARRRRRRGVPVAVRSSATAEDLPEASFAGQQETFLGVHGAEAVVRACRRCFASLFTDRAIAYRNDHGFDHLAVRLSIGVQRMVRSDIGVSGVMFTLDPDSGFPGVVLIEAAYGLGEAIVGGKVDPDSVWLFKPTLSAGAGRHSQARSSARRPGSSCSARTACRSARRSPPRTQPP